MTNVHATGLTPRAIEMRRIVAEQRASGMTVAEFAMRRGMTASTLNHWRRRFRETAPGARTEFVPLLVVDGPEAGVTCENDSRGAATAFVVELARKRKVTVPGGFAAEDLRRLIEVLESC